MPVQKINMWNVQRKGNSYLNWKQNSNDRFTDLWWGYGAGERFTSWDQIYYNSIYIGRGSVLGDYNYEDWNGDGWINELDEHPLTNTGDRPLINFGLTFNASWKGFECKSVVARSCQTSYLL